MKKAIVCILMLVFAFGGSFCLAKGLSQDIYKTEQLSLSPRARYSITLTDEYGITNFYDDVKDIEGFKSIYTESAKEAQVTLGSKTKKSVICFDSLYSVDESACFLASGRELTAEDKIQADEMNVLVGGESWQNYKVGDKAAVTVKTADGEVNLKINVVGTLKTPFAAAGLLQGADYFSTMTGVIIMPYCPTELSAKNNAVTLVVSSSKVTPTLEKLKDLKTERGIDSKDVTMDTELLAAISERERIASGSKTFTICGAVLLALSLVMAALTKKVKSGLFLCAVSGLFGIMGALVYKATAPAELPPMAVSLNATYAAAASVGVAVLGVLVALMLGRTEIGKKGTSNYKDLTIK